MAAKGGVTIDESVSWDFSFTYDKDQFIAPGQSGYPGIEFKYDQNDKSSSPFSSYNYGRNKFTHFWIDFIGYFFSPNPK